MIPNPDNNNKTENQENKTEADNVMLENIRLLAKFLENGGKVLDFEIPEIKPYRNDDIELRNRIMAITLEDRKKLKINKSTLWYRQNKIKEGKRIKLYK